MAATILKLAPRAVCADTIKTLEMLLLHAREGEVIGIAYAAVTRRGYITDTAGDASKNRTFTRGMLRALDDRLSKRD